MNEDGAIGLEHQEPNGLGQRRRQSAGVNDFAACDDEAHRRWTVLSASDMPGSGAGMVLAELGARCRGSCRLVDYFELDPIGVVEESRVIALDVVGELLRRALDLDARSRVPTASTGQAEIKRLAARSTSVTTRSR